MLRHDIPPNIGVRECVACRASLIRGGQEKRGYLAFLGPLLHSITYKLLKNTSSPTTAATNTLQQPSVGISFIQHLHT